MTQTSQSSLSAGEATEEAMAHFAEQGPWFVCWGPCTRSLARCLDLEPIPAFAVASPDGNMIRMNTQNYAEKAFDSPLEVLKITAEG